MGIGKKEPSRTDFCALIWLSRSIQIKEKRAPSLGCPTPTVQHLLCSHPKTHQVSPQHPEEIIEKRRSESSCRKP